MAERSSWDRPANKAKTITLWPFTERASVLLDETDNKYVNKLMCVFTVVLNAKENRQDGERGWLDGEFRQCGQGWPLRGDVNDKQPAG